jgi:integrase
VIHIRQEPSAELGVALKPFTATLRHTYTVIAGIFRRAFNDEIIGRTPCRGIELPQVADSEFVPLTAEQVGALAEAIEPRYRAMVITAVGTGMRWSELAGLTVDRVDFLRRTLRVDRQLKRDSTEFAPPKTAKSVRTLPLPHYVIDALAAHLAEYGAGPQGHIFTTSRKTVLRYTNFRRRVFDTAMEQSQDIPADTTFHDLRHAYASMLIAAGLSPKIIQVRMGHDSITTTMDSYGHLYPESEDATRAAIDEVFRPEVDEKLTGRTLKIAA